MILTWLANAASPRPEPAFSSPSPGPRAERVVPDAASALAFDVEREAERLRLRVASAPAPRRSGRNPFKFVERRAPVPARFVRTAPAASESDAVPAAPPVSLKLIGIAERATPDGAIRSAVLSGPADVFIVAVNDQVLGRFTVVAIAAEAIELADATTGQPVRLALR